MSYYGFRPYVPVAKRRADAAKEVQKMAKNGRKVSPVKIEGRKIASNFWGKAWCDNLEGYSDYENRLPRGRTYVRNGSVVDLQIERGKIRALVSGSELYDVTIDIATMPKAGWASICSDCLGSVGSLVELLQGKLSKNVMERVCRAGDGLFPSPREIKMRCSCPDAAGMCKHIAAVLYGVGARLDVAPDVLFALRGVDRSDLISSAGTSLPIGAQVSADRIVAEDDLAALFGIDMTDTPAAGAGAPASPAASREPSSSKRSAAAAPAPGKTARVGTAKSRLVGRDSVAAEGAKARRTVASAVVSKKPSKPLAKKAAVVAPPASPPEPDSRRRTPTLAAKWTKWKKEKVR